MTDDREMQDNGDYYTPPSGWATSMKGGAPYEWVGDDEVTLEDINRLKDWTPPTDVATGSKPETSIDLLTISGTLDPDWTSQYWFGRNEGDNPDETYYRDCPGGKGSIHYEYQHVGGEYNGVTFAKEEIWCYNADEELVKEIPGDAGEYHTIDQTNYVGPEPGSKAEAVLGSGTYAWDETLELYEVV